MKTQRVGLTSALIYTPISLFVAGIFFGITVIGDYTWVARIGGSIWVFLLSMIISMPLITSTVKKNRSKSAV
jgi:uncharacterized membrane protein YdjX (TVP38/TMEM64 family)